MRRFNRQRTLDERHSNLKFFQLKKERSNSLNWLAVWLFVLKESRTHVSQHFNFRYKFDKCAKIKCDSYSQTLKIFSLQSAKSK